MVARTLVDPTLSSLSTYSLVSPSYSLCFRVAELSDGTLCGIYERDGSLYWAVSSDGGETWAEGMLGVQGAHPDIAVNVSDTLGIVYEHQDSVYFGLATYSGGSFSFQAGYPELVISGGAPSVVWSNLLSSGDWYVVFSDSTGLRYATESSGWSTGPLWSTPVSLWCTSLGVSSVDGDALFVAAASSSDSIYAFCSSDFSSWSSPVSVASGNWVDVLIADSGHVLCICEDHTKMKLAVSCDGGASFDEAEEFPELSPVVTPTLFKSDNAIKYVYSDPTSGFVSYTRQCPFVAYVSPELHLVDSTFSVIVDTLVGDDKDFSDASELVFGENYTMIPDFLCFLPDNSPLKVEVRLLCDNDCSSPPTMKSSWQEVNRNVKIDYDTVWS